MLVSLLRRDENIVYRAKHPPDLLKIARLPAPSFIPFRSSDGRYFINVDKWLEKCECHGSMKLPCLIERKIHLRLIAKCISSRDAVMLTHR